jgi:hypothetical protein
MSQYEELAARRFRQYKWEKRKAEFNQAVMALALNLIQHSVPAMERAGIVKKKHIEKVSVE